MKEKIKEIKGAMMFSIDAFGQNRERIKTAINLLEELEKQLTLTDVGYCNCDESKQLEEEFEIKHLINHTYQVVGKDSNTIWKQGTMEECNDWVML